MPFNAALSAGQITSLAGNYYGKQYLAACPDTVVFAARVNQASFSTVFAQVTFDTVTTGAYTDIKEGMTVYIGATSGAANASFVGRVRKTPTSTVLYINETSSALADNWYITVTNDYKVWEKMQRIDNTGALFKDYDLPYANLQPSIYGLQSSYVLVTTGASATLALTPSAHAMAQGASISSWLWDVADGTITIGSSTAQNITASFPTGHRWVRLTVTDSNGVSQWFVFEVYCGNPNSASWSLGAISDVSMQGDYNGWSATFTAYADVSTLLPRTRMTLFTVDAYGTSATPINATVDMVGVFVNESNQTAGDVRAGVLRSVSMELKGLALELAELAAPAITLDHRTSPAEWGQVNQPCPPRFVSYLLSRHSTYPNVASVQFNMTSDTAYVLGVIPIQAAGALDSCNQSYGQINGRAVFAPQGETLFQRDAVYLSASDRNALVTVATLGTDDMLSFDLRRTGELGVGSIIIDAGLFNTTSRTTRVYSGKAPAVTTLGGQETQTLNSQILTANATDSDARTELGGRAANHLAAVNPTDELSVTLPDGYRWLVPNNQQWWVFTLAAGDTTRGAVYTTERWVLQSVSISADIATGQRDITGTWRRETTDTGAQVLVSLIPLTADNVQPALPQVPDYPDFPPDGDWNLPDGWGADDRPPFTAEDLDPTRRYPIAGYKLLRVNMRSGVTVVTDVPLTSGKLYLLDVEGRGQIGVTAWSRTFDFTASDFSADGWSIYGGGGVYASGLGYTNDSVIDKSRIYLTLAFTSLYITSIQVTFSAPLTGDTKQLIFRNPPFGTAFDTQNFGTGASVTSAPNTTLSGFTLDVLNDNDPDGAVFGVYMTSVTVAGTGTPPSWAFATGNTAADAFYSFTPNGNNPTALGATQGLRLDGAAYTPTPGYQPSNAYRYLPYTGAGAALSAQFADTDYTDNSDRDILITIRSADGSNVP